MMAKNEESKPENEFAISYVSGIGYELSGN